METLLLILIGILIGWTSKGLFTTIQDIQKNNKIVADIKNQYTQVLNSILQRKSSFKSRVNQSVWIECVINNYGNIDLLYLMDKKDIAIFKDSKCIYSTHLLDDKIKNDIISSIRTVFNKEINDTIEIMGIVLSKVDFEKTFKMSVEDLKKQQKLLKDIQEESKSDIQKIVEANEKKLSLDEILEKVGKGGYESLTQQEKEFLNNIK